MENADVNNQGWCAQENSFQVVWDLKWVRRFSVWDDMVSDVVDIGDVSTIQRGEITCNRVYCVCSGPWPFNFFLSGFFSFLIGWEFYGPNYLKCYNLCAGPAASSFPQCPCSSRSSVRSSCCLFIWSGESLHCFLVGEINCYVIATSDLWLFIHACNLLPSTPHPAPLHTLQWFPNIHTQLLSMKPMYSHYKLLLSK